MSKILLSGYYGFANAGDEAMLTSIVDALRAGRPDIEITVLSGNPTRTAAKHKVKSIGRFDAWGFIKALRKTDLVLQGGGSLLQDVTSSRSILYYLSILWMAALFGKRFMIFSQGIGPIRAGWAKKLTAALLRRATMVTVRDDGSYEELLSMGLEPERITVTADAVFALPTGDAARGRELLQGVGVDAARPVIGLALRNWQGSKLFSKEFAHAAELLRDKLQAQIVFLPLQFPSDTVFAESIIKLMTDTHDVYVLREGYDTWEYISMVGQLDLVIAMRLHALVFAALTGVPYLGVSYDPKVDRFVTGMGGKVIASVEQVSAADLVRAAEDVYGGGRKSSGEKISDLRRQAAENIRRAIGLLPE